MARPDTHLHFKSLLLVLLATICNYATPVAASTNPSPATDAPYQDQGLAFQRISLEQGLSQSTVNTVFQDSQGYLWFGTSDGLNRYDGYGFTLYEHELDDPFSLSDDSIYSLYQGQDGALWVSTQNGINKFDRATESFGRFSFVPGDAKGLSHYIVRAVYEDQSGTVWAGTADGLDWLNRAKGDFSHFESDLLGYYDVRAIYGDRSGAIWVGTSNGLVKFNQERMAVAHYQNKSSKIGELSHNSVRSIYQDQAGTLWVGTDYGLNKFDSATETFIAYHHDPKNPDSLGSDAVFAIHGDQTGALWIGAFEGGLDRFDPATGRFVHFRHDYQDPHSLSSNRVRSVYVDQEGMLWVGTLDGGVNKADIGRRISHYKNDPRNSNSLVHNTVWSFCQDQAGTLWIGTSDGVDRLYREDGLFTHYEHNPKNENSLSDNYVRAIYQDQAGNMWFGTRGGLDKMELRTRRFTHYRYDPLNSPTLSDNDIMVIIQDRSGILWIGTRLGGLNRFEPESESFKTFGAFTSGASRLSSNYISALYEDRAGMMWIGTDNGLDKLDLKTERVVSFQHDPDDANSLSNNIVLSIHEDQAGTLWIGTYQGGLNKFNPETGSFGHYGKSDGLPNDAVYGILESGKGNLWLSTNQGLSKFDPRSEEFVNFDAWDGLQSNEFNGRASYQNSDGEMFFGGVNGFNAFYPEQLTGNSYVPPVVLTSLTQGGEPVDVSELHDGLTAVEFQWPNNFFEFEFAALSYALPEKNQYAYKLQGFDEQWNEIGTRRFGRYTNLPSGAYTLRIIGSNNSGVWNEQGLAIEISIAPPFWGTWWFQGMVVLLLVAGVVGAYRWRVRSIKARSHELEAQVQQRTAELRQEIAQRAQAEEALRQSEMDKAVTAERNHLARELHDAVTQTLFSASLIAEVLPRVWQADPAKGRQQLQDVRVLTRGALAEMRALLMELRPGALAKANMRDLLGQLGRAMTGRTGVPVTVVVQGECSIPPEVQLVFYRIAQEALNNAGKHADAARVEVEFQCEPGCIKLSIGDDGQGFVPRQGDFGVADISPGHFGLGIMRERAATVGADFQLVSQPGKGTRVTVDWRGGEHGLAELTDWRGGEHGLAELTDWRDGEHGSADSTDWRENAKE